MRISSSSPSPPLAAAEFIYYPYYPKFSFKIALVALRLEKYHQLEPITFQNQPYKLWKIKDKYLPDVKKSYINAINKVGSKVKIICFGEMTYPFSSKPEDNQKFQEQLSELSREKKLYIIAGSYHDFTAAHGEHYNTSLIFTPESLKPYKQYKLKSAVKAEEYCNIPIHQELKIIGTPYGNFVVLICIDVENRSIWEKIGDLNSEFKYRDIQFIISPAFDPSFRVIEQAEAFSKTHKICVAFINSFKKGGAVTPHQSPGFYKSDGSPIPPKIKKKIIHIYNVSSDDIRSPIQQISISQ